MALTMDNTNNQKLLTLDNLAPTETIFEKDIVRVKQKYEGD